MTGRPHSYGCGFLGVIEGLLRCFRMQQVSLCFLFMSNRYNYSAMKKLFLFAVLMLSLASCMTLPERFDSFVSEVESNYETYSDVDWKAIEQKYAEFEAEYIEKYDQLNEEEKVFMKKRMGSYDAILVKASIKNATEGIGRFLKGAGDYVEGLIEGLLPSNDSTAVSE